jgi:hypothetical protein
MRSASSSLSAAVILEDVRVFLEPDALLLPPLFELFPELLLELLPELVLLLEPVFLLVLIFEFLFEDNVPRHDEESSLHTSSLSYTDKPVF